MTDCGIAPKSHTPRKPKSRRLPELTLPGFHQLNAIRKELQEVFLGRSEVFSLPLTLSKNGKTPPPSNTFGAICENQIRFPAWNGAQANI